MITQYVCVSRSTGINRKAYWAANKDAIQSKKRFISRGPFPSHGTGPFFCAETKGTGFSVEGDPVQLNYNYKAAYADTWRMWFWDGKDGIEFSDSLTKRDNNICSYDSFEFTRLDGNRTVWTYRQWSYDQRKGSYKFPTTLDGWLSGRDQICAKVKSLATYYSSGEYSTVYQTKDVVPGEAPSPNYLYGERSFFDYCVDLGIYQHPYAAYFSSAYVAAIDALELTDVNTLANIGQIIDYVHAFAEAKRNPIKALKDLAKTFRKRGFVKDLWLKYRYEYLTTKSDIDEYVTLVRRLRSLSDLAGRKIHSTGSYSSPIGSFKAEVVLEADDLLPVDVTDWLNTIGVRPTPVNLWDLVPYSFVVDWFFHVSDILDYFDKIGNTFNYHIDTCWFTFMNSYDNQHIFFRVPGRRLEIPPVYMTKEASGKTIRMRIADAFALFWR